jgi:hypothetical protein
MGLPIPPLVAPALAAFAIAVVGPLTAAAQPQAQHAGGGSAAPHHPSEDSIRSRWAERPFAIELNLAPFGSPVGAAGITLDYSVFPWGSIFAGAGLGIAGPQFAGGMRLRLELTRWFAAGISPSFSAGNFYPHGPDLGDYGDQTIISPGYWINGELFADFRTGAGFVFRAFAGASWLQNPQDERWSDSRGHSTSKPDSPVNSLVLDFTGIAFGYAF